MARPKAAHVDLSVARLRALVDYAPYTPSASAPPWLSGLNQATTAGLGPLAVLAPGGIRIREAGVRKRPALDPAAVQLLGLVEAITRKGLAVGIGLAPDAAQLPLLLAAAEVLSETVSSRGDKELRRGVLLVSPDLGLRSRYPDLTVSNVDLDTAHPGSRMRPDGVRLPLHGSSTLADGGVCFYLPMLSLPTRIDFRPALVLVDLRYGRLAKRAADVASWARTIANGAGVICLYTCGDEETPGAIAKAGMPLFPFDHRAIATADGLAAGWTRGPGARAIDWDLNEAPEYLRRQHRIVEVGLAPEVHNLFEVLHDLLSRHRGRDSPDLRRARWLLSTLRQLPTPLRWYEECAVSLGRSTLRRLIDHMGARSNRDATDLGPVIQTLRVYLDELYAVLDQQNPRAAQLLALHIKAVGSSRHATFVFRDVVFRRAFELWTSIEALPAANIAVPAIAIPLAEIASYSFSSDAAILNGPLPPRYRWVLGAHLPFSVVFVCYPEESPAVHAQLQRIYDAGSDPIGRSARESLMARLFPLSSRAGVKPGNELELPELLLESPARESESRLSKPRMQTVPGGLAGLKEFLKRMQEPKTAPSPPAAVWDDESVDELELIEDLGAANVPASPDDVDCVALEVTTRFAGHCRLNLVAEAPIDLMRPAESDELRRLPATKIRRGDILLRIEDGRREGLFDRIVEIAERQPALSVLAVYRSRWRSACQRLASRFSTAGAVDYGMMLEALRRCGATITSEQAAMWWIRELVIGPETAASIAAVGKVLEDESLIREARSFDSAFRRIRGLRSGIGRRLTGAIRKTFHLQVGDGSSRAPKEDGEDLGLPFDELAETIDLAQVESITGLQKVPPHLVDRLLPK